ncbi:MAG: hypothetical protein AAFX86_06225 [Pseudomonadota bacterium]
MTIAADSSTLPWPVIAAVSAACIAAVASTVGVWINTKAHYQSLRRQALSEIAAHRIRWIEETRNNIVEYTSLCNDTISSPSVRTENLLKIVELFGYLYMVIDIGENEELIRKLGKLRDFTAEKSLLIQRSKESNKDEIAGNASSLVVDIMALSKEMHKREWEKSKLEIKGRST